MVGNFVNIGLMMGNENGINFAFYHPCYRLFVAAQVKKIFSVHGK